MGPFLESVNPKFTQYLAKWNSGPLSCVSVFHKYVFIYLFFIVFVIVGRYRLVYVSIANYCVDLLSSLQLEI